MGQSYTAQRRVEFRDTDGAGIMHFSAYLTYMEQAEHEFWRHLGISVKIDRDGKTISWPRVHASCDYALPLIFEQEFQVDVSILRLGQKSVTFGFVFTSQAGEAARGKVTAVCCEFELGGPPVSVPIPADIMELLAPYVVAEDPDV